MHIINRLILFVRILLIKVIYNGRIKIGKNVVIEDLVVFKVSKNSNITILNDVYICKNVELRAKDNSQIVLNSKVKLDNNVRLVSAHNSKIKLEDEVKVGMGTIFNAGEDITVGKYSFFSSNCSINSSSHIFNVKGTKAKDNYKHSKVFIDQNVWIGANCTINPGIRIGKNCVISANTNVNVNVTDDKILKANYNLELINIKKKFNSYG